MKLTRLVLENFRSFEHADLDLVSESGQPLRTALLVGLNGAGTSSVLDAIRSLLTHQVGLYDGPLFQYWDVLQGKSQACLSLRAVDRWHGQSDPAAIVLAATVTAWPGNREFQRATVALDEEPPSGWQQSCELPASSTGQVVSLDAQRLLLATSRHSSLYSPARRLDGALAPTLRQSLQISLRNGPVPWIVSLDRQRTLAREGLGEEPPAWELLRRGLDRLLAPYRFEGLDGDGRLVFHTPTGLLPLAALSNGIKSLFVIVAELMMRLSMAAEDQSRMLEGEAVCLIDEIDAHLHPRWQQNVLPGLRTLFPNVQFVATTHSPLVVASAIAEEVFYIGPEEDEL